MGAFIGQIAFALLTIWLLLQPSIGFSEASIAFSQEPNGGSYTGWANNYRTQIEASDAALHTCRRAGSNCVAITNFNNSCAALAVQVGSNGYAVRYASQIAQARSQALRACAAMGLQCSLQASFCDSVREVVKTLICTKPVFTEERRLLSTVDGSPDRTEYIASALAYLYQRYCRDTEEYVHSEEQVSVGDNCNQYSGLFRGEKVYWGQCHE
ncbi:hypothetical protein ABIF65_008185 [Bradyrhizobium japonicum]